MRRQVFKLALLMVIAWSVGTARGSVTYTYETDQSSYTAAGGTATVNIYLQETLTSGSTSLINSDSGVGAAGFSVNVVSGPGQVTGVTLNTSAVGVNGGFGVNGTIVNNSNSSIVNDQTWFNGATGQGMESVAVATNPASTVSAGNNRILLGTVTISGVTSTTTLNIASLGNGVVASGSLAQRFGDSTVSNGTAFALDHDNNDTGPPPTYFGAGDVSNQFTINPSPVPEPSSVVLTSLAGAMFGFAAWRRRRKVDAPVETEPLLA